MMRRIIYWLRPNAAIYQETLFLRFRRVLYKCFLKMLMYFYKRYAFSDTITIDNYNIKLIHEYRDFEFENMLREIGIETCPQIVTGKKMTFNIFKGYKFFVHTFRFEDDVRLFQSGKEVLIKRDGNYYANTDMYCKFKVSIKKDIISRSWLECGREQEDVKTAVKCENTITLNDNVKLNRGVEIDESF